MIYSFSKKFFLKGIILIILIILLLPNFCSAQGEIEAGLTKTATAAGFAAKAPELATVAGKIVGIVIGLSGFLLTIYLIYGGFLWMTSAGEEEKIKKAKGMITNAIIGLVIVIFAYVISSFVIGKLGAAGR